jgi:hypothetical protein
VEQIVGTVKNVRRVESTSKEQASVVNIQFRWDTDMDAAFLWVQEKLGLVQDLLPLEAKKPEVTRYNPFDRPVLLLAVTGDLPAVDLQHLVETRLRPALEKTLGVSGVDVSGGVEREIQVTRGRPAPGGAPPVARRGRRRPAAAQRVPLGRVGHRGDVRLPRHGDRAFTTKSKPSATPSYGPRARVPAAGGSR